MTRTKELKPPQELVDAIQASDDMTAPADATQASELTGQNVPRTVRTRLEHEEFAPLTDEQRTVLEQRGAGTDHSSFLANPEERQAHEAEVAKAQESAIKENRDHLTAGKEGPGPQGVVNSKASISSHERPSMKGPHHKNPNAHHKGRNMG